MQTIIKQVLLGAKCALRAICYNRWKYKVVCRDQSRNMNRMYEN